MALNASPAEQLDAALKRLAPFVTALIFLLLDLAPTPFAAAPSLALAAVFYWSVARPDLFGYAAAFALGLMHDAVGGGPMGAMALVFALARGAVAPSQRFLASRPFTVVWSCFFLLALLALSCNWAIGSLFAGALLDYSLVLAQAALSFAAYPLVSWLLSLSRSDRKRGRLAQPRF